MGDEQGVTHVRAVFGSRRPFVAVRLHRRNEDGSVVATVQTAGSSAKAGRLKDAVERIMGCGAGKLDAAEWTELFRADTPAGADSRWLLLLRLAALPQGKEGELRDQFVALPDGTAFSIRLLLIDGRAGGADAERGSFAKLPAVVQLEVVKRTLQQERQEGCFRKDGKLAELLEATANDLGLKVDGGKAATVSDLRKKLRNNKYNNGDAILPAAKDRRQRHEADRQPSAVPEDSA